MLSGSRWAIYKGLYLKILNGFVPFKPGFCNIKLSMPLGMGKNAFSLGELRLSFFVYLKMLEWKATMPFPLPSYLYTMPFPKHTPTHPRTHDLLLICILLGWDILFQVLISFEFSGSVSVKTVFIDPEYISDTRDSVEINARYCCGNSRTHDRSLA